MVERSELFVALRDAWNTAMEAGGNARNTLLDLPVEFYGFAVLGLVLLLLALWAMVSLYAFTLGLLGRHGPDLVEYEYGLRAHAWLGRHLRRHHR